jgi:hypothetical protein
LTIASVPHEERDGGGYEVTCDFGKAEYFCERGLTGFWVICPPGCFVAASVSGIAVAREATQFASGLVSLSGSLHLSPWRGKMWPVCSGARVDGSCLPRRFPSRPLHEAIDHLLLAGLFEGDGERVAADFHHMAVAEFLVKHPGRLYPHSAALARAGNSISATI